MSKKVFIGIAVIDKNNEVNKALGVMKDMQTGETERINTENLSDKAVQILLEQSEKKLRKEFRHVVEYVPRKGIEK